MNNNEQERLNGEIRYREKVMRGLKRRIRHDNIREHESLNGRTSAEACGIEVVGENKWQTLIQNEAITRHLTAILTTKT